MASPASKRDAARGHRSRKIMTVTVNFLDDSSSVYQLQAKSSGQVLFDKVCKHLNLIEVDYFGLEYEDDKSSKCWLESVKPLCSQVASPFPTVHFGVKFYAPDPTQLEDELTRYLFALQIRRDLASGRLQCNDNTAALLSSCILQAEVGDYDRDRCLPGLLLPSQDPTLERKIIENHKKLAGQSPAAADLSLLETARRCELYGIRMAAAKDHEGVPLNLAVAHMGIVVFQNFTKINTFSWAKIRKLSFKRKKFLIKLHPEGYGYYKDTVEFFFEGRNECKNFWKRCIENHTFFRCSDSRHGMRQGIFSRGSSFRYSGRTQKQVAEFVRENSFKRQPFQRSTSLHTPSSPSDTLPSPLPAGSASCGSISNGMSPRSLQGHSDPGTLQPAAAHLSEPCSPDANGQGDDTSHDSYDVLERDSSVLPEDNSIGTGGGPPISSGSPDLNGNLNLVVKGENNYNEVFISALYMSGDGGTENGHVPEFSSPIKGPSDGKSRVSFLACPEKRCQGEDPSAVVDSETSCQNFNDEISEEKPSTFYISSPYAVKLANRKRHPLLEERSHSLAKELLMTERTHRRDLEIVDVVFRGELGQLGAEGAIEAALTLVDPLYEGHCSLLRDLEQRMAIWEGRPGSRGSAAAIRGVGDILLSHQDIVRIHTNYLEKLPDVLASLHEDLSTRQNFARIYHQFEAQKVCYLPLTSLLARPAFRPAYYAALLRELLSCYDDQHVDYANCLDMLDKLRASDESFQSKIVPVVNFVKLMELQHSTTDFRGLVQPNREFVREGCLFEWSTTHGSEQRMGFLFSDLLLLASRPPPEQGSSAPFKVTGFLSTGLVAEECDLHPGARHCISLRGSSVECRPAAVVAAAPSARERLKWLQDLARCADIARCAAFPPPERPHWEEGTRDCESLHHPNTSSHICWHRNVSIGFQDVLLSMKHPLSGYLLRKFKSSSGWQKVWVVLANLCLFFYRSHLEESPLASLPLVGYRVLPTCVGDHVSGGCIFKLTFKNHEYFFTAENSHSLQRWVDAIGTCTLGEEESGYPSARPKECSERL